MKTQGSKPVAFERPGSRYTKSLFLALLLLLAIFFPWHSTEFDWTRHFSSNLLKIPPPLLHRPHTSLRWRECPDNSTFYCTFFEVPLDYDAPNDPEKTVIAMRMFPATVSSSERLGSVFTNPGGPGGSGHASVLRVGPLLSDIFEGKFDIIGWDPRGVNMTTPRISCHATDLHRALFALGNDNGEISFEQDDRAILNRSLLVADAQSKLTTSLCRETVGDKVLRSVTTVNVVRDLEEMRKVVGDGGLRYWGFSYGTLIGATYVAMFPEQAERVILDGVIYSPEPYNSMLDDAIGTGTSTNSDFDGFVSHCASVGAERCALAGNSSAFEIADRIWTLASRLEHSPIPISRPSNNAIPAVLHRPHFIHAIFMALYRPASWPALAEAIAAAEQGNATLVAELTLAGVGGRDWTELRRNITDAERAIEAGWPEAAGREMGPHDASAPVVCGDAPPFPVNEDHSWTEEWMEWREQLIKPNPIGGAAALRGLVSCRHWGQVKPTPKRYEGSWEMGVDLRKPKNPVVFLSNSFDPITPLNNAIRMVDLLGVENARLLHNNGYGHCSVNHPSLCVAKHIRKYMLDGTVFENGTLCEPEDGFIFPKEDAQAALLRYDAEDVALAKAMYELADAGIGMPVPDVQF
ncbi:hypothetical protein MIND_00005600 [Mycena indigotica]|uniref:Uncharacterized protein n=1 Tax=Mycena indigotica TaxID=2126181 RepID=A0A8H6TDU0_9AGAR|nr:uncharacterized protein MIND_00005600 [Mycena indigotica]KAF7314917.1 hypothetical protein MIND_00005600 [Mycena indigotica]